MVLEVLSQLRLWVSSVLYGSSPLLQTIKIMEVPVIKIKETHPGKAEEKLIKSIMHMVCWATMHICVHAACCTVWNLVNDHSRDLV